MSVRKSQYDFEAADRYCTNCPPMKIPCTTQGILHFKTIALLLLHLFISDTKSPGDRISVLPQCPPVIRCKDHNAHPWCDVQVVSESLGDSHRLDAGGSCGVPVPHECQIIDIQHCFPAILTFTDIFFSLIYWENYSDIFFE